MVNDLLENAGYLCLVTFAYAVWPPAALLAAGILLIFVGNMRAARRRPDRVRLSERLARALAAYRSAPDRGGS